PVLVLPTADLRKLPVTAIKIDQAFIAEIVTDPASAARPSARRIHTDLTGRLRDARYVGVAAFERRDDVGANDPALVGRARGRWRRHVRGSPHAAVEGATHQRSRLRKPPEERVETQVVLRIERLRRLDGRRS